MKKHDTPKHRRIKKWIRIRTIIFLPLVFLFYELSFSLIQGYKVTLYNVGFTLSAATLLLLLSWLVSQRVVRFVIQSVGVVLVFIAYISQFFYTQIFGTLYYLQSIVLLGDAMTFSDVLYDTMADRWYILVGSIVPLVLFFIFQRKGVLKTRFSTRTILMLLSVSFVLCALTTTAVLLDRRGAQNPRYLYASEFIQEASLKKFGLLTTMRLDFRYHALNWTLWGEGDADLSDIEIIAPTKNDGFDPTATSQLPISTPTPTPVIYGPNVLDIEFDLEESDATFREMNLYFSQRKPTMQNDYTGMFEGKNLILITAEGFSKHIIDPELTPTLYMMANEGFVFENFYTVTPGNITIDGEFIQATGLIPKGGGQSYNTVAKNYMPFSFGHQFANLGYQTLYYHNHTYNYYNRHIIHPSMGYIYKGVGNGLDIKVNWPSSDLDMIEATVSDYINNPPFHVGYMTVSGHLEYNFTGNYIAIKNKARVEHLPYSTMLKAYLACNLELEFALAALVRYLDTAGELENTVIALSTDHYPYGLDRGDDPYTYDEMVGHKVDRTIEKYENAFILWSASMEEPVVIDKYCSSLDIAPTLANLFALPYDSRLYMGSDILSDHPALVIFHDNKSFITDRVIYNAHTRQATVLTEEPLPEGYLEAKISEINQMSMQSVRIIDRDYYGYLFKNKE